MFDLKKGGFSPGSTSPLILAPAIASIAVGIVCLVFASTPVPQGTNPPAPGSGLRENTRTVGPLSMTFRSGTAPFEEGRTAEVLTPEPKAVVSANGREVPPDIRVMALKDLTVARRPPPLQTMSGCSRPARPGGDVPGQTGLLPCCGTTVRGVPYRRVAIST